MKNLVPAVDLWYLAAMNMPWMALNLWFDPGIHGELATVYCRDSLAPQMVIVREVCPQK